MVESRVTWDVAVVGAGPAGALASRELVKAGASVLLLDRAHFPRWKVCGACLSPGAVRVLADAGLEQLTDQLGAVPVRDLVLIAGPREVRLRLEGSVAVSRAVLDRALVESAVAAGAEFWPGARVSGTEDARDSRRLSVCFGGGVTEVAARVVLDATGLAGRLDPSRRWRSRPAPSSRVGLAAIFDGPASSVGANELRMVVGRGGYVGLVRLEDGRLNVAAAVDGGLLRTAAPAQVVQSILAEGGQDLLDTEPVLGWRGTPALTRTAECVAERRLFRLGDSAGYVEPFTGEGMCWAFNDAMVLAPLVTQAVARWDPHQLGVWDRYRRRQAERSRWLCRALAWGLRRPDLVRTAIAALQASPRLARPFVRGAARVPRPLIASVARH